MNNPIVTYNVTFNCLAIQTGWDNSMLCHQYYSGLAKCIKDIMGQQVKPFTLSTMKNLAHTIDSHHWECFCEKSILKILLRTPKIWTPKFCTPELHLPLNTPLCFPSYSDKSLNPTSDKLGKDGKLTFHEWQHHFDNNMCLFCGSAGHMINGCPKSLAKAHASQVIEYSDYDNSNSEIFNSDDYDSENSGLKNSGSGIPKNPESVNSDSEDPDSKNPDSEMPILKILFLALLKILTLKILNLMIPTPTLTKQTSSLYRPKPH